MFSNISQAKSTKINILGQEWTNYYFKWQVTSSSYLLAVISQRTRCV